MRILVTGGAGFIGSHLVERLVKDGHDVLVLDNLETGCRENISAFLDVMDPQHLWTGDIRSFTMCLDACKDREIVFHLAALGSVPRSVEDPQKTNEVNVNGTLNMLLAAREAGVKRFVNFSSSSVYGAGACGNPPLRQKVETQRLQPLSPYGVSKLAAEGYCRVFAELGMLSTISLRPFNVFGPRQRPEGPYAAVVPRFVHACLGGQPMVVFGDGSQTRDFTYVANVVDACLLAAGGFAGECSVNIGCGDCISVERLAQLIALACGVQPQIEHTTPRRGDVRHSSASIGLARGCLGYEPSVDVVEGITRTVAWVREQGGRP